ncbi:MAG: rhomboid family intramembrane serine protease [Pirellulales bacterium]
MIIPYNTDAPLYHRPFATIGLIAMNTLVFVALLGRSDVEPWMLAFGQGLQPVQWITSLFLHDGLGHLLGNMLFLWVFGLVIEGKLGWWRFLLVYLGLGAFESGLTQILMQHQDGFALGASGAIFGLLAMALIWAPSNEINCIGFWTIYGRFFDVPILCFAGFYVGMEFLLAWMGDFAISSAMLHLAGALPGFGLGIIMLKLGLVDCEQWDIFAVIAGRQGEAREPATNPKLAAEAVRDRQARHSTALALFNGHLVEGRAAEAAALHQRMSQQLGGDWTLTQEQLLILIKALHQQELWSLSVGPMTEYLRASGEPAPRMHLKLAQILLVHENRPGRALRALQKIPPDSLPANLDQVRRRLESRAAKQLEEGELELTEEGC